jgi:hypothetical protein
MVGKDSLHKVLSGEAHGLFDRPVGPLVLGALELPALLNPVSGLYGQLHMEWWL